MYLTRILHYSVVSFHVAYIISKVWLVGLPYMVDEHKTPFRKRSNGQRRVGVGVLADTGGVRGRLRRLGATQAGGGTRKVSSSRTLQT